MLRVIFLREDEQDLPSSWDEVVTAFRDLWPLDSVSDTQLGAVPPGEPVVLVNNIENGKQISVEGTEEQQAAAAATLARFYRPEDKVMIYLSDGSECRPIDSTLTVDDMWNPEKWTEPDF